MKTKTIIYLLIGSFVFAHACFLFLPNVFEIWNAQIIDRLFLFKASSEKLRPIYDKNIVHVDINDSTLKELKTFYLNRTFHAKAIENLSKMNTAAQLFDFIFAEPSSDVDDAKFIDAVSKAENVYFGLVFRLAEEKNNKLKSQDHVNPEHLKYLDRTKWNIINQSNPDAFYIGNSPLMTFTELASASKGLGFLNAKPDRDGVDRRIPFLIRYNGSFYPGFSFRAVCDYLNVKPEYIFLKPGKVILKNAGKQGEKEKHDIEIPIDQNGNMRINFIGGWDRPDHYQFVDMINAGKDKDTIEIWKEELSGKIVIVSEVTTGSSDVGPVPTDMDFPLSGLHSNAINTILTESFIKELSTVEMIFIELFLMILILIISLRFSSLLFSLTTLGLGCAYYGASSYFFIYHNIILNIVRPLLMITSALVSILIYRYFTEEKEKSILLKSFEAYFPPSIVKKIMENPQMITQEGHKKELTIMFSDIKSFTGYSSTMEPGHIRRLLNEYFEAMTDIVFKYEGTVDKFIGDGLMVFFGDPDPQPDHALRCVKAALEMQKKVSELRAKWSAAGDMPLHIRIGINTGIAAVGNMGSPKRLSYTVIGSAVNMAQRLESNAPVDGILISQRTCELLEKQISVGQLRHIRIKGYGEQQIPVYDILFDSKL